MKVCRVCGRASGQAAGFCSGCGRSLGARVCREAGCAHPNPVDALYCERCGNDDLTEGAACVQLGLLPRLLGALLMLAVSAVAFRLAAVWLWPPALRLAHDLAAMGTHAWAVGSSWLCLLSAVFLFLPDRWRRRVWDLVRLWSWLFRPFGTALRVILGLGRGSRMPGSTRGRRHD